MVKAIGLLSGGLDSMLAARVLKDQGIEVLGLTFETPFFSAKNAKKAAEDLGIELKILDVTEEHLKIVKNPKHGYGKTMNPCIDCHAFMFKKAGQLMKELGYDFIFSGEVLGERPMSQNFKSLQTVGKESKYGLYLLRPLSAKLLPETKPEIEGKVDRQRLLDFQGRSRKRQMELAEKYGIRQYPTPAGGCLLTDPNFSLKLKDLLDHDPDCEVRDLYLLKVGRHLRLSNKVKLIIGRDKHENKKIRELMDSRDLVFIDIHYPGPTCLLVKGIKNKFKLKEIAAICASYSDGPRDKPHPITIMGKGKEEIIDALPKPREECQKLSIFKA